MICPSRMRLYVQQGPSASKPGLQHREVQCYLLAYDFNSNRHGDSVVDNVVSSLACGLSKP
jgi:hypothetical protein